MREVVAPRWERRAAAGAVLAIADGANAFDRAPQDARSRRFSTLTVPLKIVKWPERIVSASEQHAIHRPAGMLIAARGQPHDKRHRDADATIWTAGTRLASVQPMMFHVGCELDYAASVASTLILSVHAHRSATQTIVREQFSVEPPVKLTEFSADGTGNRFVRLETGTHEKLNIRYAAEVDCDFQTYGARSVEATPVADLEASTIPYLFPSRYCQSDRLSRLAWDLFGSIENPHNKVVAIGDWIHENVEYMRGSTNSMTSAFDTVTQRTGVCRDFSHLAIALCRALNIPARYFSGYAYELDPPDFHACFECFIGGSWVVFDATRLAHLNGLVRIGTGRDAADAAVASIFGKVSCTRIAVTCTLGSGQTFQPIDREQLNQRGVTLAQSS